jgi:hypothetical protein
MSLEPSQIRYRVDPADVPLEKAARRLHLTPARFTEVLPRLIGRGFPRPDPDTGMFDLEEIDTWRRNRHRPLASGGPDQQQSPAGAGWGDRISGKRAAERS